MTNALVEWILGRDREGLLSYDFTESHPIWKAWWFRGSVAAVCIAIVWYLLTV